MTRKKFGIALMCASFILSTAGASACAVETPRETASGNEQSKSRAQTPQPSQTPTPMPAPYGEDRLETNAGGEIKELAAGGYGAVKEAFIYGARAAQTSGGVAQGE